MPTTASQITVLVTIRRVHNGFDVRYTYNDPASGQPVLDSAACILNAPAPYFTLFSLDYPSTRRGWTFVDATPKPGSTVPSYSLASNSLSLTTYDDGSANFRFDLAFLNVQTNDRTTDDPQENNVPQPGEE